MQGDSHLDSRWSRIILHADMDAFYASVEQRDRKELRGKPIVVGGTSRRSVVSTASYEARKFGLKSAMPVVEALRLCPSVIVVPPDFSRYKEASSRIMRVFANYSPLVEPLSLDEAFIDMSGTQGLFGTPEEMAKAIKRDVVEATSGLTVSVGIATTKYVAKVASDFQKPDGLTLVSPGTEKDFLWPLPISKIWGVGPKTRLKIEELGLKTIGQLARFDKKRLVARLGVQGEHIWNLAQAIDDREVIPDRGAKSVGKERTLEEDIKGLKAIWPHMKAMGEQVARQLRKKDLAVQGVRVKLKTASFRLITRQAALPEPTNSTKMILKVARSLLDELNLDQPFRLVGLAGFNLVQGDTPVQQSLFRDAEQEKNRHLDSALDKIMERFGDDAVHWGEDE